MRPLDDAALMSLWEVAVALHPLDRALVLCSAAREDVPPAQLADLPIGEVNRALLALRRATFGPRLAARVACRRCSAQLEIALDAEALAGTLGAPAPPDDATSLRALTMRDLAAVASERDVDAAAHALAQRCWLAGDRGTLPRDELERRLEALDPAADIALEVSCDACGAAWHISLDLGAYLWTEVSARVSAIFADVDRLARTYGWTESEVLALSPPRRAAYLELCAA